MLNPLQEKLLEMFAWLVNFLEANNLRYYALGGTMLGAVRHKGFIPWDDDIDIGMPRNDYEKLIDLLKEPVDHYVVEAPRTAGKDYLYRYAKLYDINTSMTEHLRKDIKRGVFIDVFPLDGIGNTLEEGCRNYKKIDRSSMFLAMKVCAYRSGRKWWKNLAVFLGGFLPINEQKLAKQIDSMCAQRNFDDYRYVGNLMSTYRAKEIIDRKLFGEPSLYQFEGLTIKGPEKYEEYLTHLFGNWRKLPPVEKRISPHTFEELSFDKPYMELH